MEERREGSLEEGKARQSWVESGDGVLEHYTSFLCKGGPGPLCLDGPGDLAWLPGMGLMVTSSLLDGGLKL